MTQRFVIHHHYRHESKLYFVESSVDLEELDTDGIEWMCKDLGIDFRDSVFESLAIHQIYGTKFTAWEPNKWHCNTQRS